MAVVRDAIDSIMHRRCSALPDSDLFATFTPTRQTAGEISAGVTPFNYAFPPQTAIRYSPNTTPGTTDMATGIQAAIDSASVGSATVLISDQNAISRPLLIRSTTVESIGLFGNARVVTELQPFGSSIATAPDNVNALIICKNNNAHLHLTHLRSADSNFTGYFMYALPGGADPLHPSTASFSMVIDDCWFSPSQNGSGVFYGFYSNAQMTDCVFESTKTGCWRFVGGASDILCTNITMNACFDSFIYAADDTTTKALLTVQGLHAYGHLRGPLFQINNGVGLSFHDVILEPSASQISGVGLFQFQDCSEVFCSQCYLHSRSGVPQAAGPAISIINTFTGRFSNIVSDALIGIQFSGTGAIDLILENCDFSGANIPFQVLTGSQSGRIVCRGCRFNNAQQQCLIQSAGSSSFNIEFYDCEFMNAGLNGTSTNYNIDIAFSGNVIFYRCKIGHDNGSAAAAYYLNCNGVGTVTVIDPVINANPPTGVSRGTQSISWDGISSLTAGFANAMALTPGGTATLTAALNRWTLKGGVVHFYADITINVIGTGSAVNLSGLPFTSSATYYGGGIVHFFSGSVTNVVFLAFSVSPGGTTLVFRSLVAAAAGTANNGILQNGTRVILEGSYPL